MNIGWIALPLLLFLFPAARQVAFLLLLTLVLWLFWLSSPTTALMLAGGGLLGGGLLAWLDAGRATQSPPDSSAARQVRQG